MGVSKKLHEELCRNRRVKHSDVKKSTAVAEVLIDVQQIRNASS